MNLSHFVKPNVIRFASNPSMVGTFDPSQKRNEDGEWGDGGGSSTKKPSSNPDKKTPTTKQANPPSISTRTSPRSDPEKPARDRAAIAKQSHNPSTKEKQDISERIEHEVTTALGGIKSGDNKPMDVISQSGRVGFEVKAIHDAKAARINMRKDSRQRKEAWVAGYSDEQITAATKRVKDGQKTGNVVPFKPIGKPGPSRSSYIIAVDNRDTFQDGRHASTYSGNKYYVYKGVGAVSLNSMTKARDLNHIKQIVGIK